MSQIQRDTWDNIVLVTRDGTVEATWDGRVKNLVYDVATMSWVAETQPGGSSGGSSGGVTSIRDEKYTKTLTYTGGVLTQVQTTFVSDGATLTKTLTYSGGVLTQVQVS